MDQKARCLSLLKCNGYGFSNTLSIKGSAIIVPNEMLESSNAYLNYEDSFISTNLKLISILELRIAD